MPARQAYSSQKVISGLHRVLGGTKLGKTGVDFLVRKSRSPRSAVAA